ncbi:MAG: 2,3-butanediol dehydrogenase [Clostridiales bacterium]|nr:2,3-butanediol dehydrogenase [Clostridiales bacterium]
MKAALWYGARDIRVENVAEPSPSAGEVVIKVKRCGICGTDLHEYLSGPHVIPVDKPHPLTGFKAPIIMGHEMSGEIVETGPGVCGWKAGDRVAIMPLLHCGKCYYCRRGLEHLCQLFAAVGLQWYWGGFGEYCLVKDYQLNRLPDNMTCEQGACCEPMSLALYGIRRSNLQAGSTVLITGGGPTAVFTLMGCIIAGASKVFMSEIQPGRATRCREFGADEVFDPLECDIEKEILERTGGVGVDAAFECTGIESAINNCFAILRKRGMYVQCGLNVERVKVNPFDWAFKDLNMVGLWCFNTYDFPSTLELISTGRLKVEKTVTKVTGINDIVKEGFETLTSDRLGKEMKIQVSF